jgi:hypothetical protein
MQHRLLSLNCHERLPGMENEEADFYSPQSLHNAIARAFTFDIKTPESMNPTTGKKSKQQTPPPAHVCQLRLQSSAAQLVHPYFNAKYGRANVLRLAAGCVLELAVDLKGQEHSKLFNRIVAGIDCLTFGLLIICRMF